MDRKSTATLVVQTLFLLGFVVLIAFVPTLRSLWLNDPPPPATGRRTIATIAYFIPVDGRNAQGIIVVARTRQGIQGQHTIPLGEYYKRGCRKGDRVYGTLYGNRLEFDGLTCRRPTQTPQ